MANEEPLKVTLFIVLNEGSLGPIPLGLWKHHTPDMLTSSAMDEPFAIPHEMRTESVRRLYSLRNHRVLDGDKTYGKQGVSAGDVLTLTDMDDPSVIDAVSEALAEQNSLSIGNSQKYEETRTMAVLRGVLEGIPWAGPALAALLLGPKRIQ